MQEKREVWLKNNIQSVKSLEQKVPFSSLRSKSKSLDYLKYKAEKLKDQIVLYPNSKVKRKFTPNGWSPAKIRETLSSKRKLATWKKLTKWFKRE